MLAAVFEGAGKLTLKEVEVPIIKENTDVIIRVESVSICGTDVHIVEIPPGFIATPNTILGHELAGRVVEVGNGVLALKKGHRVVVNPNDYDCTCKYCKLNLPNQCEDLKALGIHVNGGFAKYCKVTEKVCHIISDTVSPDLASLAEPLACVINGTEKIKIQPSENAVILGGGPIGLLFLKFFKLGGARVIVSEVSEYRQRIAKENEADLVIDPTKSNLIETITKETELGADVVVDTTGSLLAEGIEIAKKSGRFLIFGVNEKAFAKIKQINITIKELKILGTWLANATFPKAVKLIESGKLNLEKLITHKFSLSDVHKGIELLVRGEALKIILNP